MLLHKDLEQRLARLEAAVLMLIQTHRPDDPRYISELELKLAERQIRCQESTPCND